MWLGTLKTGHLPTYGNIIRNKINQNPIKSRSQTDFYTSTFLRLVKRREMLFESSILPPAAEVCRTGIGGSGGPVFRRKSANALVSVCLSDTDGMLGEVRKVPAGLSELVFQV